MQSKLQVYRFYLITQSWLTLDCDRSSRVKTHFKLLKHTGMFRLEICNFYLCRLQCSKLAEQTFNELKVRHIGKQPLRCFHPQTRFSAISEHESPWLEKITKKSRSRKNTERRDWWEIKFYIVFHPSAMENDENWLRSWTTNRKSWMKHTWAHAGFKTSVCAGRAASSRLQSFSDVWQFYTEPSKLRKVTCFWKQVIRRFPMSP